SLLPDPLPAGPKRQAVDNLVALGAVEVAAVSDDAGTELPISALHVTATGRTIARIPASVWSARGLLDGADLLSPARAAEAIAVIESDQRAPGADLFALLRQLRRSRDARFVQDRRRFASTAREFASESAGESTGSGTAADESTGVSGTSLTPEDLGLVTSLSYPLQIARLRSASDSEYLLASGTAASLP